MMLASLVVSAALTAPLVASQGPGAFGDTVIRQEYDSGGVWWTVRVRNFSATKLADRLAELTARSVEGREHLRQAPLLTVDLDRRPLDQVLEFALGSVGLRHELRRDTITVVPAEEELPVDELMATTAAAWVRAISRFPDVDEAPMALLAQGELAELRGLEQVAREYYVSIIEDHADSEHVDHAYMRAGRLSAKMGLYTEAARYFRALANRRGSEYCPAALLELARAEIALGNPHTALQVLRLLDEDYPPIDPVERTARSLVRASAHNQRDEPIEALRELDEQDTDFDPIGSWEALWIRAIAMEGMSMPGEAARAWLAYSHDAVDEEKERALEMAARLSLEDGDELGTLFVCREAARLGIAGGFPEYRRRAREALGFAVDGDAEGPGIEERIVHGEELLEGGEIGLASVVFESLYTGRRAMDELEAARSSSGWAACVAAEDGIESAVSILSIERLRYRTLEARKRLDTAAARLLEDAGLLERAVEAYRGSY